MLLRALIATLVFAVALGQTALYAQSVELELEHIMWTLVFSLPIGLSVLLGSLGTRRLEYPSLGLCALALWNFAIAPAFIVELPEMRYGIVYSLEAGVLGRWLFLVWCLVFAMAAGRAREEPVKLRVSGHEIVAIAVPIAIALVYQLMQGMFTAYQVTDKERVTDTRIVIAACIGKNALVFLPGFFLLVASRVRQHPGLVWFCRGAGAITVILLLLTGGRSGIAFSAALGFYYARSAGYRVSIVRSAVVLAAVPIAFLLVFAYRNAVQGSEEQVVLFSDLTSMASNSASDMIATGDSRDRALGDFSDNVRIRAAVGLQFFAVVENWLSHGAAFEWTFADGLIRVLPSYLFPGKNELAMNYGFEGALKRTGRVPDVDLAPTFWMQWLFEFGLAGLIIGAVFFGRLVRLVERRIGTTSSVFEVLFWGYVLSTICTVEVTTDILFLSMRDGLVVVSLAYGISRLIVLFTRSRGANGQAEAEPSERPAPHFG
ncbi:MAG: hypothetical protein ABW321_07770 [Polyangiales bacterium]